MSLTGVVPLKHLKSFIYKSCSVQVEREKIVNISFWQICSVKRVTLKSTISLLLSVDKYMRLQMSKLC